MEKSNVFRSSSFHMDEGDRLHMLIIDETGDEVTFVLGGAEVEVVPGAPTASAATEITDTTFVANWSLTENTLGYYLDVAYDSAFTSFVAGYEDLSVGNVIEYEVTVPTSLYTYYYRVRGSNDIGTSDSSSTITLTTEMEIVLDGDGNVYTYVTIGAQQWLVENLETTKYIDGTAIPNLTVDADWIAEDGTAGHDGAYCWYDNDGVTYADYGCLYNWYAVDNAHGLAPTGWRVPSAGDWNTLKALLGGESVAGGKLKEIGLSHWDSPNTGATNEISFTAVAGGRRPSSFILLKDTAMWWTDLTYGFKVRYNAAGLYYGVESEINGFSVRCMRDI